LKRIGVIVPADNDTVLEDLSFGLNNKYEIINYKMEETGNNGYPENNDQENKFINDLKHAGEYFKKNNVKYIVYGRGYGTYNEQGRKSIRNILKCYAEDVLMPTDLIMNRIADLKINAISVILPYTRARGITDIQMFSEKNIKIEHDFYLNTDDGKLIAGIKSDELCNLFKENADKIKNSRIIVIQCTALHTAEVIERLKLFSGNVVLSSNSVLIDYLSKKIQ
jgi:maleate cis-trans isomerase